jgi:DNA-binding response OmpR family regulator
LLELSRILLSAEGYDVATSNYEGASLALIKQQAPEVILFDLVKDREEPWTLLRELRADPDLRDIGVMVTSATPSLIDRALGDPTLRVANGLVMPFDIDDLYARLEETINRAQSSAPLDAGGLARNPGVLAAAQIMGNEARNILFRWVQRISTLEAYRQRADLDLDGVRGEMGGILDLLTAELDQPDAAAAGAAGPGSLRTPVSRHVALRKEQGVSPADVVRECQMLRSEAIRALRGSLHLWRLSQSDAMVAQERIGEAVDQVIVLSVEEYGLA